MRPTLMVVLSLCSLASCRSGGQPGPEGSGGQTAGGQSGGGQAGGTGGSQTVDAGAPLDARPFVVGQVVAGRQVNSLQSADQLRQLDLLFMIDNSSSMIEEQDNLARNIPNFIKVLEALPGGLPDLHVAVISSDLGAGPTAKETCRPLGDAGKFLVKPGCGLDAGTFLTADARGNKNFTGELGTVLGCLTRLGTMGCNQEHQLQSIRAALSDVNAENRGFLRPEAHLAIILLTDEDDCSADPDTTIFDQARPGEALSFRCNALGHVCDGRPLPAEPFSAPLASCKPYTRSAAERTTRLIDVGEIADFVKQLKPGQPDRIVVSAVTGWSTRPEAMYRTARNQQALLEVQPVCAASFGSATPAVRLKAFVDAFGANGAIQSICDNDFTPALAAVEKLLAFRLGNTCLEAPLLDIDPARDGLQAECRVVDRVPRPGGFTDRPMDACGAGQRPCWELVPDPACRGAQRLRVDRAAPAPAGTLVAAACRGEDSPPHTCGGVPCPVPPVMAGAGEMCDININYGAPAPPRNLALWRGDDRVCSSHLCVRPAPDPLLGREVDTAPLCTAMCTQDSDCAGAVLRDPTNQIDKRCRQGFGCGVAFETGPLRCVGLCLCRDFLSTPPAAHPPWCATP